MDITDSLGKRIYRGRYLMEHYSGAAMYGMPIGESLPEITGIALESLDQFYGIETIPPIMFEEGRFKVQSAKSFVRLVMSGNMKAIDTAFLPLGMCIYSSEHWEELTNIKMSMIGYEPIAERTLKFFTENTRRAWASPATDSETEQFCSNGYKRRILAAGFRAMVMAAQIMQTGEKYKCVIESKEDIDMIREIRDGITEKDEISDCHGYVTKLLDYSIKHSVINRFPDSDKVNHLIRSIYRRCHNT